MSESRESLLWQAEELETEARRLRAQAEEMRRDDARGKPLAERLVYSATARCVCGSGLAYDLAAPAEAARHGCKPWACAAVLLGTQTDPTHGMMLPLLMREIKEEGDPTLLGQTTRQPRPAAVPGSYLAATREMR